MGFIEPSLCLSRLYETEENVLEFEEKLIMHVNVEELNEDILEEAIDD